MTRRRDLVRRILSGRSDAGIRFEDLCNLLRSWGFVERRRGSHHIFRKDDVPERINLQREGAHAKPYQVRQVRQTMLKHELGEEE